MKNTLKLVALTGAIAVFSACGQSNNEQGENAQVDHAQMDSHQPCLLYTSPSPRDLSTSRMPSSA